LTNPSETDKPAASKPVMTRAQRQLERAQASMSAFAEIEAHRLHQAENMVRLKELRLKRDAELALQKAQPKPKKSKSTTPSV
jgi:hypothetical protein